MTHILVDSDCLKKICSVFFQTTFTISSFQSSRIYITVPSKFLNRLVATKKLMDNSNPQNQTPAQDLQLSYSSVLSQFSTPLTNLTTWLIEPSTPLLSGSSETSLTNSTPSFDATVYSQSSQTVYTQSSQSSIAYNANGIMQEEHHEPNQPVEDHAVTSSPTLNISNAVGLTSATVPTSSQKQPVDPFEERVYNVVKTTPPAKKMQTRLEDG